MTRKVVIGITTGMHSYGNWNHDLLQKYIQHKTTRSTFEKYLNNKIFGRKMEKLKCLGF